MTDPSASPLERLFALVRRELRADDVHVVDTAEPDADNVVCAPLPDSRQVVASFVTPPDDREALARRLGVIVATFTQSLRDEPQPDGTRASRPHHPVALSLHDELRALATRARAVDAVVIDAHSPVVWGSAIDKNPYGDILNTPELTEALRYLSMSRHELVQQIPPRDSSPPGGAPQDVTAETGSDLETIDPEERRELTRVALREVRLLPEIESLRRGRPLRDVMRRDDLGYVVHSFAAIYLALLVFDGPFDELRAQRAITDALPRVERLVLALPPFDPEPEPMADVISIRRSRRR